MQNNSTRQKMLSERGLTLEKCLEIARSHEATRIRMKAMQENGDKDTVNRVHKYKKGNRSRKNQGQSNIENKSEQKGSFKKCYFCGRDYHKRELCPAKNVTCNNCTRKGHLKEYASLLKKYTEYTMMS
jgi:hypothetical protein